MCFVISLLECNATLPEGYHLVTKITHSQSTIGHGLIVHVNDEIWLSMERTIVSKHLKTHQHLDLLDPSSQLLQT
jgi:hypothetical protein